MPTEEDLFFAALELPAADRAAFFDRACAGDAALRTRLDQLLEAHAAADSAGFLASITFQPGSIFAPHAGETSGSIIADRYTLIRKLGEGGCGTVYLAEQTVPVRRQVALKIIKLGMDTRDVVARFEAERQTLALMDHPDIARVFDAGATAIGRPYFVMEFVDGVPITKFCEEHRLTLAARLKLFARVCLALQHAHQKGVIHRDLKPSNILVSLRDGAPAPRIIDFGIAKATSGRLGEPTLVTALDQFIGTPAYMSPEQAGGGTDIDTRSDIYSLGVLLYELLAGRPLYDPQTFAQTGRAEICRQIREVDPPRPSAFVPKLKGDLDWIVMRCLEKDRARRYATAGALADDLERYLADEPITARPPSTLYRIRKLVARNRFATAALTAVTFSLLTSLATSTTLYFRAHRAELRALAERDHATAATHALALAHADALRRQDQSEQLLNYMLDTFRYEARKSGRLELLDAISEKALAYFASLDPGDLNDVTLAQQVKTLTQIGATRFERARYPDADAAFTAAYSRATALTTRHPENPGMLIERAQTEFWIGLSALYRGDFPQARFWFERYRDSTLAYAALTGRTTRALEQLSYSQHSLALLELDLGRLPEARTALMASQATKQALLAGDPQSLKYRGSLAATDNLLGLLAESQGRFAAALAAYRGAATTMIDLQAREPHVPLWGILLAEYQASAGRILALQGQRADAARLTAEALTHFAPHLDKLTANKIWQANRLNVRLAQLNLFFAEGDLAATLPLQADSFTQLQALVAATPTSLVFSDLLAETWVLESRLRHAQHRTDAAAAIDQAIAINDAFIARGQPNILSLWTLGQAQLFAGRLALAAGQPDAARAHWQRIIAVLTPPATDSHQWRLLDPLAQAHLLLGDPAAAAPYLERLRALGYHPIDPAAATLLGL